MPGFLVLVALVRDQPAPCRRGRASRRPRRSAARPRAYVSSKRRSTVSVSSARSLSSSASERSRSSRCSTSSSSRSFSRACSSAASGFTWPSCSRRRSSRSDLDAQLVGLVVGQRLGLASLRKPRDDLLALPLEPGRLDLHLRQAARSLPRTPRGGARPRARRGRAAVSPSSPGARPAGIDARRERGLEAAAPPRPRARGTAAARSEASASAASRNERPAARAASPRRPTRTTSRPARRRARRRARLSEPPSEQLRRPRARRRRPSAAHAARGPHDPLVGRRRLREGKPRAGRGRRAASRARLGRALAPQVDALERAPEPVERGRVACSWRPAASPSSSSASRRSSRSPPSFSSRRPPLGLRGRRGARPPRRAAASIALELGGGQPACGAPRSARRASAARSAAVAWSASGRSRFRTSASRSRARSTWVGDPGELQLGAVAAALEPPEARGLLDERAPLGRLRREDLLDAALADHRVHLAAEAEVGEQLDEIGAPDRARRSRGSGPRRRGSAAARPRSPSTGAAPPRPRCRRCSSTEQTSAAARGRPSRRRGRPRASRRAARVGLRLPAAQTTASAMFDFPEPFGPTTTATPGSRRTSTGSGNDLKPRRRIERRFTRCEGCRALRSEPGGPCRRAPRVPRLAKLRN